ncbi:MAG: preprotein translocase subunit SecE [Patescibacteria group bacterium]|nr:preprotein translocase subunit SecE [Patescibacteria group bacterium]
MLQFFKDSFRELKHVVWPTKEETIKYFIVVVSILIIF